MAAARTKSSASTGVSYLDELYTRVEHARDSAQLRNDGCLDLTVAPVS
jgi:hypothetical protein